MILDANFIILIVFLFLNFFLCLKAIPEDFPLVNIIFALFSIIVSVAVFLPDSNIPAQPYITALVALLGVVQLIINVLRVKI